MDVNTLKDGFIQWVEEATGDSFPDNPYLSAALDDQVAFVKKVTFNGVPAVEHYGIPKLYKYLFTKWVKYAELLMDSDSHEGHVLMNKRDIEVPATEEEQEEVRGILEDLSDQLG